MPGLITITQRNDGDNVTAAIYNADRQEIVNGMEPVTIDDGAATVSAFQQTIDPGEVGSENLPNSLLQWMQMVQFTLKEMKGTAQWYSSLATRTMNVPVVSQGTVNVVWTASGQTLWVYTWRVPDGWDATSSLTFNLFRRFSTASGTAKMYWFYSRVRDGQALSTTGNGVIDITHVDGLVHLTQLVMPTSVTLAAGDIVRLSVGRDGDDVGDTNTGSIVSDGHWLTYSGIASR